MEDRKKRNKQEEEEWEDEGNEREPQCVPTSKCKRVNGPAEDMQASVIRQRTSQVT